MVCKDINYNAEEILKIMEKGGQELEDIIDHVVKVLSDCTSFIGMVFRHVKSWGGNHQDAEDLIQEGLMQLVINLLGKKFRGGSSIENYTFGICKNLWMNKTQTGEWKKVEYTKEEVRKDKKNDEDIELAILLSEKNSILWKIVNKLTGKCPQFLWFWAFRYSHREIAELMTITEQRSRNAISECRKKLRKLIDDNPDLGDLLK